MPKNKLSERQAQIIECIETFTREKGFPPTIRQIGEAVNISSTSVVNYNLDKLEKAGLIKREEKTSRGVRLANRGHQEQVRIPLAGVIFASQPTLVGDTLQTAPEEALELTRDLIPGGDTKDLYALRVKGDSMIDAMVSDGDIVVMRKVSEARNGEMVAVWLTDRQETTLKHFYRENNRVRLQPANPTMGPIFIDDPKVVQVQGRVVLVLRQVDKTNIRH
jgi:repressor LexA